MSAEDENSKIIQTKMLRRMLNMALPEHRYLVIREWREAGFAVPSEVDEWFPQQNLTTDDNSSHIAQQLMPAPTTGAS